jgi:hypothetical protein
MDRVNGAPVSLSIILGMLMPPTLPQA